MPLFSAFCASLLLSAAIMPATAAPLASEQWNKRIVLAFGAGPDAKLKQQIASLLADREALRQRDMLVLQISGDEVTAPFGSLPRDLTADGLRQRFDISRNAGFTVILVGKDGGEKLRSKSPVTLENLIDLIDSMPMRRREAGGS